MAEDQISEEPIVLDLGSASGFLTQQEIEDNWDALFPECEDEPRVTLRDVNSASVDLHLGSECFVYSAEPRHLTEEDPYVTIPNGEFALLTTWETVHVPLNTLGLITLRHRYKKQGLVNISGFHLDPGFRGLVHYSVHNVGPSDLRLRRKDRMFTVFFATLTREAPRYDGDHQGQKGLSPQDLAGQPVNLVQLSRQIDQIQDQLRLADVAGVGQRVAGIETQIRLALAVVGILVAAAVGFVIERVT